MGVANAGQQPFAEIFPGIQNPQSTGAAGSAGVGAVTESGTPLGAPVTVTIPGWTSQGPQPSLQVGTDDTLTPAAAGPAVPCSYTWPAAGTGTSGVPALPAAPVPPGK